MYKNYKSACDELNILADEFTREMISAENLLSGLLD